MRKAYVLILIGIIFIHLHLKINNFDLLHDAIGYLLVGFGATELKRLKPSSLTQRATWLAWGLLTFNLLQPVVFNFLNIHSILYLILIIGVMIAQFFVYYLILSVECVGNFKKNYAIIGGTKIILYFLTCFIPAVAIALLIFGFIEILYLFYAFYQLQKKYSN